MHAHPFPVDTILTDRDIPMRDDQQNPSTSSAPTNSHDPTIRRATNSNSRSNRDECPDVDSIPDSDLFFNRELSWLEFNRRVLHQALDQNTPLLERVQFLNIFTSNLDEFYQKRVGGLKRQIAAGIASKSIDGLTPREQIAAIRKTVIPMLDQQAVCFKNNILPALKKENVHLLAWNQLTDDDRKFTTEYFENRVFPVLTPLSVDSGHPFPFISNLSLSLAFIIAHPDAGDHLFARVKIPEVLPRWIELPSSLESSGFRFANLVDIIKHNARALFCDMSIVNSMLFRITRNADIEHDEEDAEDLLELITESLRQRRFAEVVRLEHEPDADLRMLRFLFEELQITEDDVYEMPGPVDYTDLKQIAQLPISHLHFEPWTPRTPPAFANDESDIFSLIRSRDVLVHHPYENFDATVRRFIDDAADDPRVIAIKMTFYRTGDDSPFVPTLIRAAETGKQVVCMVELQARFDEQRNIICAQTLENAGVHVVYGIAGLKTHSKTVLVVRNDPDGTLRCYAHIGTGNYHVGTARLYTDLGLLTADPNLTGDLVELFHYITGRSLKKNYRKLLVAPVNMRDRFLKMIQREIDHQIHGKPAAIVAKMNALEDHSIIRALYRASQAGVPVDLIVRGFCCLRPGIPEFGENIRVFSIIGRFLEHARIFHFRNAEDDPVNGEFFIGSADWMTRNQTRRVEAITPVEAHDLRRRLWYVLQTQLHDRRLGWELNPDGSYTKRKCDTPNSDDNEELGSHRSLMQETDQRHRIEAAR